MVILICSWLRFKKYNPNAPSSAKPTGMSTASHQYSDARLLTISYQLSSHGNHLFSNFVFPIAEGIGVNEYPNFSEVNDRLSIRGIKDS